MNQEQAIQKLNDCFKEIQEAGFKLVPRVQGLTVDVLLNNPLPNEPGSKPRAKKKAKK